jgi:hypothetical protein
MAVWSRSQSQAVGSLKGFASSQHGSVKALGNLQPTHHKVKVANIREAKRADRLAREASGELEVVKVREYLAPIKAGFVPTGFGRGRRSKHKLAKMDDAIRASVERKRALNAEFHAQLRAEIAAARG